MNEQKSKKTSKVNSIIRNLPPISAVHLWHHYKNKFALCVLNTQPLFKIKATRLN